MKTLCVLLLLGAVIVLAAGDDHTPEGQSDDGVSPDDVVDVYDDDESQDQDLDPSNVDMNDLVETMNRMKMKMKMKSQMQFRMTEGLVEQMVMWVCKMRYGRERMRQAHRKKNGEDDGNADTDPSDPKPAEPADAPSTRTKRASNRGGRGGLAAAIKSLASKLGQGRRSRKPAVAGNDEDTTERKSAYRDGKPAHRDGQRGKMMAARESSMDNICKALKDTYHQRMQEWKAQKEQNKPEESDSDGEGDGGE